MLYSLAVTPTKWGEGKVSFVYNSHCCTVSSARCPQQGYMVVAETWPVSTLALFPGSHKIHSLHGAYLKGAMTRHAHTIRLPLCMVSLGPRAKLLVQETKAYIHYSNLGTASWTAISRWSLHTRLHFARSTRT